MAVEHIVITGAASGIGRETARRFAADGWQCALLDIQESALAELAAELGAGHLVQVADVTDAAALQKIFQAIGAWSGGKIDVLFNAAGIMHVGVFESRTLADHDLMLNINVKGIINVTYTALPYLQKSSRATVINMSSASAAYGTPDLSVYSASKFAVRGLTEALNVEWHRHNIWVCDVMPPFVNTPMVQNVSRTRSMDNLGVTLQPSDIANVVWKAAHRHKIHWPVTLQFRTLRFFSRIMPDVVSRLVMRYISGY